MKTLSKILETLEKIKTDIRFLSESSHSRYLDVSKNLSEYKAIIEQQDRILQAIFKSYAIMKIWSAWCLFHIEVSQL